MKKQSYSPIHFLICVALLGMSFHVGAQSTSLTKSVSRNDHIIAGASIAKPYIDFDKKGFLINGKRTFIVSAGMEYARVPRGLWRDRLLKLKRGGFNAVEIYTFWNYHEPQQGKFDFSGDHDLNAFLKLVNELDMYTIVRVGPYYCGEWNFGGYPIWLKFIPGLRVREDNPQFLQAVDKFFNKLIPIVSKNQIHRGGSVIMVQLENEHTAGWGDMIPNQYFKHLQNKILALGIQVPYYFSGLHPGNDPAGTSLSLDDPDRPNPWFSAEYWSVWFFNYGPQPNDAALYDRRTWKILAHGGSGYNVYMAHGGTNFGYTNDKDMAASYDYGAAIGQAGDLRPVYYAFKKAAWFARSFQEILENSEDASAKYKTITKDSVVVTARKSDAGTLVFLDNSKSVSVQTLVNHVNKEFPSIAVTLAPSEIMSMVYNFKLTSNISLMWAPSRIYSIIPQGTTTTLLVHGQVGSTAQLYFKVPTEIIFTDQQPFKKLTSEQLSFSTEVTIDPKEYSFSTGQQRIRILAVSSSLADRSWFVEANKQTNIITGPAYVSSMRFNKGKASVQTEKPWKESEESVVTLFPAKGDAISLTTSVRSMDERMSSTTLSAWQTKNASEPVSSTFNDKRWKTSEQPLQIGADGDVTANAWYRTTLHVAETGSYTIRFKNIRDRALLFLDGEKIGSATSKMKSFDLNLTANKPHQLTVFTAHDGRNKQIFYIGPVDTLDVKGITGPVTLQKVGQTTTQLITNWRMKGGPGDPFNTLGWQVLKDDVLLNRPQFYKTEFVVSLNEIGSHPIWRVNTSGLGHGSVWINGHHLGRYPEKIKINGLYIPENWLISGTNKLVIYDEDGARPDKVAVEVETAASSDILIFESK